MTRLLITGGCGFVGANLAHRLAASGDYELTLLDNLSLGNAEYVAGCNARIVRGDIRDAALMSQLVREADGIVHLAASTRVMDSIEDPAGNFEANVVASFRLLSLAREHGVGRFIAASTGGAILGDVEPPTHEDMPARPISPYGASKLAMEGYCSAFAGSFGLNTLALRFSNVYGPRSYHKGSVVAHFYRRILRGEELVVYGAGDQLRDYVHVDDVCAGIHLALQKPGVQGVIQLASGRATSVNDLLTLMREAVFPSYPIRTCHEARRAGEVKHTFARIGRARTLLGFEPQADLREGLRETWRWFHSHVEATG